MKKMRWILIAALLGCMVMGCGSKVKDNDVKSVMEVMTGEAADKVCVLIQADNTYTDVIREKFDADYYDLNELKEMLNAEIASYNSTEAKAIEIVSVEQDGDDIVLVLKYQNWDTLAEYSADEAMGNAAISSETMSGTSVLDGALVNAEGASLTATEILNTGVKKGYHKITAAGQAMTIYLEKAVVCTSSNAKIVDAYTVEVPAEECVIVTY